MLRHAIQAKVLQIFYGIASENYWIWDILSYILNHTQSLVAMMNAVVPIYTVKYVVLFSFVRLPLYQQFFGV